jgi:hypothetical protein
MAGDRVRVVAGGRPATSTVVEGRDEREPAGDNKTLHV